jgi:anti-anti-sigma regulatory factor
VARTAPDGALTVTGSIDHWNAEAIARCLVQELNRGGESHVNGSGPPGDLGVDVSGLEFVDVAGIRAMVGVAQSAPQGRRLVLHGLPHRILTVMTVVGWADHPKLVIDEPSR